MLINPVADLVAHTLVPTRTLFLWLAEEQEEETAIGSRLFAGVVMVACPLSFITI